MAKPRRQTIQTWFADFTTRCAMNSNRVIGAAIADPVIWPSIRHHAVFGNQKAWLGLQAEPTARHVRSRGRSDSGLDDPGRAFYSRQSYLEYTPTQRPGKCRGVHLRVASNLFNGCLDLLASSGCARPHSRVGRGSPSMARRHAIQHGSAPCSARSGFHRQDLPFLRCRREHAGVDQDPNPLVADATTSDAATIHCGPLPSLSGIRPQKPRPAVVAGHVHALRQQDRRRRAAALNER